MREKQMEEGDSRYLLFFRNDQVRLGSRIMDPCDVDFVRVFFHAGIA